MDPLPSLALRIRPTLERSHSDTTYAVMARAESLLQLAIRLTQTLNSVPFRTMAGLLLPKHSWPGARLSIRVTQASQQISEAFFGPLITQGLQMAAGIRVTL